MASVKNRADPQTSPGADKVNDFKPFPYQVEGVKQIKAFKARCVLADEMGVGKTVQALMYLRDRPKLRPALIVCNEVLKWNWKYEAEKFFGFSSVVLTGTEPSLKEARSSDIIIINYDILHAWADTLIEIKPRILIPDETGNNIGSPFSRRFKALHAIKEEAGISRVIALSGSPFESYPINLWPTLHLVRPDLFPNYIAFGMKYCRPRFVRGRWQFRGAARTKQLHRRLFRHLMIRRKKDDVFKNRLQKKRTVIPIELTPDQWKEYDFCRNHFMQWVKKNHPSKVMRVKRAPGLVQLGYLMRMVAKMKRRKARRWIDSFLKSGKKIIIFTQFRSTIEWLSRHYKSMMVVIDGKTRGKVRHACVARFQSDPNCRMIACNLKAGGVGITLTASSDVLFCDFPLTPGALKQAEDRSDRIGQKKQVHCHYLAVRNTVEEKLCDLLITKQDILNKVLDGIQSGETDLDILKEIMKD